MQLRHENAQLSTSCHLAKAHDYPQFKAGMDENQIAPSSDTKLLEQLVLGWKIVGKKSPYV